MKYDTTTKSSWPIRQLQVHPTQKVLAVSIIICCIAGLAFANHANYLSPYSANTKRFVFENVGVTIIVVEALLAYLLKRLQHGTYWFNWLQIKKPLLDERQRHVRQQVFERSYFFSLIILLFAISYASTPIQYVLQNVPGSYDLTSRVIYATGILTVSLPSILAAWRKDS